MQYVRNVAEIKKNTYNGEKLASKVLWKYHMIYGDSKIIMQKDSKPAVHSINGCQCFVSSLKHVRNLQYNGQNVTSIALKASRRRQDIFDIWMKNSPSYLGHK